MSCRPSLRCLLPLLFASAALVVASVEAAPKPPSSSKGGVAYKWVDEQGVTHYGDHIPPEYASQEQHIMNSQGVEISRLDAQKSAAAR